MDRYWPKLHIKKNNKSLNKMPSTTVSSPRRKKSPTPRKTPYKPCKPHQTRDPVSKRCRNTSKPPRKNRSPKYIVTIRDVTDESPDFRNPIDYGFDTKKAAINLSLEKNNVVDYDFREYMQSLNGRRVFLLKPDHEDIYNRSDRSDKKNLYKYHIHPLENVGRVKTMLRKGYFWLDVGPEDYGFRITVVSDENTLEDNKKKIKKLQEFSYDLSLDMSDEI